MSRILVVEDERELAFGLQANLEVEGHEVEVAHTGEAGLEALRDRCPDLVLLDVMLPGVDGFEVLRRLRQAGADVPVLLLTARAEEVDKVRGFRAGADDYVTKPFGVMELLLRVEALLRRGGPRAAPAAAPLRLGAIVIDPEARSVSRDGAEVSLTPRAFDLLMALVRRRGKVVSRHDLLRDVWGYAADVTTRTVDAHVAELRRKLERDPAEPRHIVTVWKIGYRAAD
jgi:DNA-binding response OmpR family regulator